MRVASENKTAFFRARVEPKLKNLAEGVLQELGITPTQAITMLYKKIVREHEWPVELKIPNEETQKAIKETDAGIGLIACKNSDDLFKKLGIKKTKKVKVKRCVK
jgi:DNA-damage-inducible protein J